MKKKLFCMFLGSLLSLLLFATTAMAETWFANEDKVKVYEEKSKDSRVVKEIKGGSEVLIETHEGGWFGILVGASDGEGQTLGWIEDSKLVGSMPSRYCSHNWSDWSVLYEATCTEAGMRIRDCSICGVGQSEDIPAKGHSYGEWTTVKEATCVEEGTQVSRCSACGDEMTRSIEKRPHSYSDWQITKNPSCTAEGERVSKCSVCGKEEKETIAKTPHNYGEWTVTKKATCTAEGEQVHKCKTCGQEEKQTIKKLPHDFDKWNETKKATCTAEGERVHKCKTCGFEEKETIKKLPHNFEVKILKEATDHSSGERAKVCKDCKFEEEKETFDPEGTLRRGDKNEAVAAMQQLLIDHKYLSEGGADGNFGGGTEQALMEFQKAAGLTPDGIAWPQTLKKLEHVFGPWEVTKAFTRSQAGERTRVCTDCGFEQHELIEPEPSISINDRSEAVRAVQQILKVLDHDAGNFDGIYGPKLDTAYGEFAKENHLEFEAGTLLPVHIDALINAWTSSLDDKEWKAESEINAPVNLALTVDLAEDAAETAAAPAETEEAPADTEADAAEAKEAPLDDQIDTYTWTLTNLGSEKCLFNLLLLSYGDDPDFRSDNLVLVLDGEELKANHGNTLSGSFKVSRSWGKGNLNIAALSVTEEDGLKWLSNTVTFEQEEPETETETEDEPVEAITEAFTEAETDEM